MNRQTAACHNQSPQRRGGGAEIAIRRRVTTNSDYLLSFIRYLSIIGRLRHVTTNLCPGVITRGFRGGLEIGCDIALACGFRSLFRPDLRDTSRVYGEEVQHDPGILCWPPGRSHATGWRVQVKPVIDVVGWKQPQLAGWSRALGSSSISDRFPGVRPSRPGRSEARSLSERTGAGSGADRSGRRIGEHPFWRDSESRSP